MDTHIQHIQEAEKPMSHYLLPCRGKCPVASNAKLFQADLLETAQLITRQLNSAFSSSASLVLHKCGWHSLNSDEQTIMIYDQAIIFASDGEEDSNDPNNESEHLYCSLWLALGGRHQKEAVLRKIISISSEIIFQNNHELTTPAPVHLVAWFSILAHDLEALQKVLQLKAKYLPACSLLSLLLKSIDLSFDKGAEALLSKGASARHGLSSFDRPITVCVRRYREFVNIVMRHNWQNFDIIAEQETSRLSKILKALLENCDFKLPDQDFGALFGVCDVALFDGEVAGLLIESANVNHLNKIDTTTLLSALLSAINDCLDFINGSQRANNNHRSVFYLEKMFTFGVLPLLQAGARFKLSFLKDYSKPVFISQVATPGAEMASFQLWGRPNVWLQLLVEGCDEVIMNRKQIISKILTPEPDENIDCVLEAIDLQMRHRRGLQAAARHAVLRNLKRTGLKSRNEAIDSLLIPSPLKEYLKFSEFKISAKRLEDINCE